MMAIPSTDIPIRPAKGDLSPKKKKDQSAFRTSYTPKMARALLTTW